MALQSLIQVAPYSKDLVMRILRAGLESLLGKKKNLRPLKIRCFSGTRDITASRFLLPSARGSWPFVLIAGDRTEDLEVERLNCGCFAGSLIGTMISSSEFDSGAEFERHRVGESTALEVALRWEI